MNSGAGRAFLLFFVRNKVVVKILSFLTRFQKKNSPRTHDIKYIIVSRSPHNKKRFILLSNTSQCSMMIFCCCWCCYFTLLRGDVSLQFYLKCFTQDFCWRFESCFEGLQLLPRVYVLHTFHRGKMHLCFLSQPVNFRW